MLAPTQPTLNKSAVVVNASFRSRQLEKLDDLHKLTEQQLDSLDKYGTLPVL